MQKQKIEKIDDEQYFDSIEETNFERLSYDDQIIQKQQNVIEQFHKRNIHTKIQKVIAADNPKHYRHKVTASATNVKSHGKLKLRLGFFIEKTHKIKPVFESILHDKLIDFTLKDIEKILQKYNITAYVKGHDRGVIKHVLIRKSYATKDLLVVFVTQGKLFPNSKRIINELREKNNHLKSVIQIIQKTETHIVLYGDEKILFGPGYIIDNIEDLSFKLSAKSFYQVNPAQMLKLYQETFDLANIKQTDTVLDCYAGIGTLSLLAAKQAKSVIAVEMNTSAVTDAIGNAKKNNIKHVKFIKNDVEKFIETYHQPIDVLIIDPPRIGASIKFIEAVKRLKPKRIVYISCFVETQARDIQQLLALYHVKVIQPVDMFPYTSHIENIVLLEIK